MGSPEEYGEENSGSIDSGSGTGAWPGMGDPEGQGYMGGWNKLKKAVWGEDDGIASSTLVYCSPAKEENTF